MRQRHKEVAMRLKALLTVSGALALVFGFGFYLAPVRTLALYSASTGPVGYIMTRFFGAALVQAGLILLSLRSVREPALARNIAVGAGLGNLVGLHVALYAVRNHLVSELGWSTVAIYALLALGFGWFAFKPGSAT
jgi:hypothetical protein